MQSAKGQAKTNYLCEAAVGCTDTVTHSDHGFVSSSPVCLVGVQLSQFQAQRDEQWVSPNVMTSSREIPELLQTGGPIESFTLGNILKLECEQLHQIHSSVMLSFHYLNKSNVSYSGFNQCLTSSFLWWSKLFAIKSHLGYNLVQLWSGLNSSRNLTASVLLLLCRGFQRFQIDFLPAL